MSNLVKLIALCKAGISLEINQHRNFYESVEVYIKEACERNSELKIESTILSKMIETDCIVELQFYPNTPVGFYIIYHYDLEQAIEEGLKLIPK